MQVICTMCTYQCVFDRVHGVSLQAWRVSAPLSLLARSVHWWWRTTLGEHCVCVWLWGCWVEKTLFWLAVLYKSLLGQTRIPHGLGVLCWTSRCQRHESWRDNDSHSKLRELVVCLSSLLSSTPHQHSKTLSLKPQPLALKQSCLTHWAHIPPDTVDGCADYLRKDKLSTSSSIHLTGCLACCQPCASGNVKRYLFSTEDINHKGIFPPAFQKWVEFSCRVLGLQFLQRKAHKERRLLYYLLLSR